MSELYAVKLIVQPNPIVQQTIEYHWLEGTWFNETENRHTGFDTVTNLAFPNIVQVQFGELLQLSAAQWHACGKPLLLTLNEIAKIKQVLHIVHQIDKRQ